MTFEPKPKETPPTKSVSLPVALCDRVDAYRRKYPGLSRSDVVTQMVNHVLDSLPPEAPPAAA